MSCLFCKIVVGEIPNHTVYEDDTVLAFLDIHPCAKGHTVVIPKTHVERLSDLSDEQWTKTLAGVQKAMKRVYAVLQPQAVNIGINDGPAAGQAVSHVHWHILPRNEGDGGGSVHSIIRSKETGDVAEVVALFKV